MNKRVLITGGGRGIRPRRPAIWQAQGYHLCPQLSPGQGQCRGAWWPRSWRTHPVSPHRGAGGCQRGGRGGAPVRGDGRGASAPSLIW